MTFEFDGVLGLGLASLAVDPEFSVDPSRAALKSWVGQQNGWWYHSMNQIVSTGLIITKGSNVP